MKKLLLGIAVCGLAQGECLGIDTTLIDGVVSNPLDCSSLTKLVSEIIKDSQKALQARSYIHSETGQSEERFTSKTLQLYRICSMLYQLSRDIRSDEVDSLNYYVYGAINGSFGPFLD